MAAISGNGTAQTGLGGPAGYGETALARSDAGVFALDTSAVFAGGFTFGGANYGPATLYVASDGFVTFGAPPDADYLSNPSALTMPFIAPFMADIDTRLDGEGAESGPIWVDIDPGEDVVTITWAGVGFYRRNAELTNTFQLQLFDRGAAGMDVAMRYQRIDWTSGDLQGGWAGTGGRPAILALRMGPSGALSPLTGWGDEAAQMALPSTLGNTGVAGLWVYNVPQSGPVSGLPPPPSLLGGGNADMLFGLGGPDTLQGLGGDDLLEGGGGGDLLDGGSGADTATYTGAAAGVRAVLSDPAQNTGDAAGDRYISIEHLQGSAFADLLVGNAGANRLMGGAGDDTLMGGIGADTLLGGLGFDWADYSDAAGPLGVSLGGNLASSGAASGDLLREIEGIIGGAHDDTLVGAAAGEYLIGAAGRDLLRGEAGDDTLQGGMGDDTLQGGAGADRLLGGEGADWASYEGASAAVQIDWQNLGAASGDAAGDQLEGIEGLIGSAHGDQLAGDAGANRLAGGSGNDQISGGAGDDSLWGDAGDDTLAGGAGADALRGGAGLDWASYAQASGGVIADLASPALSWGEAAGDSWAEIEALLGSAGADTLGGDGAANLLEGGAGDDLLDGRGGPDTLFGGDGQDRLLAGPGADVYYGGAGWDLVSYIAAVRGQIIDMLASGGSDWGAGDAFSGIEAIEGSHHGDYVLGDLAGNALYGGFGEDCLFGGYGADSLYGGAQNDLLEGGEGDDWLRGGAGQDLLSGGAGADRFVHEGGAAGGTDWILDFVSGSGDALVFDAPASASDFALQQTSRARLWKTSEPVLVVQHLPTGQDLWVIEDQGRAIHDLGLWVNGQYIDLL